MLPSSIAHAACQHPTDGASLELLGDVNGDGKVNVPDALCAILVNLWAASGSTPGLEPGCATSVHASDLDCSLATDVSDAVLVIGLSLGADLPSSIEVDEAGCPTACCDAGGGQPVTADAGTNASMCTSGATLAAAVPSAGAGEWSVITGSATFADASDPTTAVTGLGLGDNTLRWTVTSGCQSATDDVVLTRSGAPNPVEAGMSQSVCATTATLAATAPTYGTGQWMPEGTSASVDDPAMAGSTVSGLEAGDNTFRWTVSTATCGSADDTTVVHRDEPPSLADAGSSFSTCEDSAPLSAIAPSTGLGEWTFTAGAGTLDDANAAAAVVGNLMVGDNTLRWEVTSGVCMPSTDSVTITRHPPVTASMAGTDQNLPANQSTTTLAANTALAGTGEWTVVEGDGIVADPTSPTSSVSNLSPGLNVFRWTITNGPCTSASDVAVIRPIACNGQQVINSPADVQNLRVCSSMGHLVVDGVAGVVDLSWLTNLETIVGSFRISDTPDLVSLTGLENLTSVGSYITIERNDSLSSLSGLAGLNSVGTYLLVSDNPLLTTLGLSNLTNIGEDLIVVENASLPQCDADAFGTAVASGVGNNLVTNDNEPDINGVCMGVETIVGLNCALTSSKMLNDAQLWRLAGCTTFTGFLDLQGAHIYDVTPLYALETVDGSFRIWSNPPITSLQGLENLREVTGYLYFHSMLQLTSFAPLANLETVGNYLAFYKCDSVIDLAGFDSLQSVGTGIRFWAHVNLLDISGFPNLTTIGSGGLTDPDWSLYLHDNSKLANVSGFNGLQTTDGTIYFHRLGKLADVSGFQSLTETGLDLEFNSNNELLDISGFDLLATVNRDLRIQSHADLVTLNAFPALTSVLGSVEIILNGALQSIAGFPLLASVSESVRINQNDVLSAVTGFAGLTNAGTAAPDAVEVSQNPLLTDLSGFAALDFTGGDVRISRNDLLPSLADLSGLQAVGGSLRVEQNDAMTSLGLTSLGVGANNGIGENLAVFDNFALDQCLGIALRDQIVNDPNGSGIGGTVSVALNDPINGCTGVVPPVPDCNIVHTVASELDMLALASCTSVAGLDITNSSIVDMSGLESLQTITGDFVISDNTLLTSVAELTSLTSIGGSLIIHNNDALMAVDGMSLLTSIGVDFEFTQNLMATDFSGLSSLETIGGTFLIYANAGLSTFTGLGALQSIGGLFRIDSNASLTSMAQLTSLASINALTIWSCGQLATTAGFEGLTTIPSNVYLYNLPSLTSLEGFANITTMGTEIRFQSLAALENFTGMDSVTSFGTHLLIDGLSSLVSLQGLGNVTTIGSIFRVRTSHNLVTTAGMGSLQSVGSYINFSSNDGLESISGFTSLTTAGSYIYIEGLPSLETVDFSALSTVSNYISIQSNSDLAASLDISMDLLTQVGSYLRLEANPALSSLSLASLPNIGTDFIIFDNAGYPECEAQALADAIDDIVGGGGGVDGVITIGQNDTTATCP